MGYETYTMSIILVTLAGRGKVPAGGNILDSKGDFVGFGRKTQKGVALSRVTPLTNSELHAENRLQHILQVSSQQHKMVHQ